MIPDRENIFRWSGQLSITIRLSTVFDSCEKFELNVNIIFAFTLYTLFYSCGSDDINWNYLIFARASTWDWRSEVREEAIL